jgi:MSHA biogenesis protein MshP
MTPGSPGLQRGFAAIAAIFLVVVLAALGTFIVTFSNTQQVTATQDVQGSRAYWAARAGLEWAVVAVPAAPSLCNAGAAAQISTAVAPASVDGFTVQVFCSKNSYTEGSGTLTIFRMESRALSGGAVGSLAYVERSVSASIETSP